MCFTVYCKFISSHVILQHVVSINKQFVRDGKSRRVLIVDQLIKTIVRTVFYMFIFLVQEKNGVVRSSLTICVFASSSGCICITPY